MTETQTTQPVPENEVEKTASTIESQPPEGEAELPPEPWTPERVNEWNAYYDLYVMAATLLLAFVVACNSLSDSSVFSHLKAGQLIQERSRPLVSDEFSYTEAGQPWVDLPWLFQWSHAALYNLVYGMVPEDPLDVTANRARADQIAIGSLVILDALVRLTTAWVLLKIRRRGPGLWWSAICVTVALGVVFHPLFGIVMGGIAHIPELGPSAWGQLFLALEVFLLFRVRARAYAEPLGFDPPVLALGELGCLVPDGARGVGRSRGRTMARRRSCELAGFQRLEFLRPTRRGNGRRGNGWSGAPAALGPEWLRGPGAQRGGLPGQPLDLPRVHRGGETVRPDVPPDRGFPDAGAPLLLRVGTRRR